MGTRLACLLLLPVLVLAAPGPAVQAHTRSASYSSWELTEDGARVRLRIALLELTRLPPQRLEGLDPVGRYLSTHLTLASGGEPCAPTAPPSALRASEGWVHYEWRLVCAAPGELAIESRILLEVAPSHLHFARLRGPQGGALERVLTESEPRWPLPANDAPVTQRQGTTLPGYVGLGIAHILTGWDHLAFVLALLLLASTVGEVAALVTSFTVAHSVTLALAVLGIVHPNGAAVEALIGYSIALVAAENAWLLSGRGRVLPLVLTLGLGALTVLAGFGIGAVPALALGGVALFTWCHFSLLARSARPARLRSAVAFGFGLVHGFGFAGILAEMALPTERLVPALFGFNLGVEVGQLAVVIATWPLLLALARWRDGHPYRLATDAASAAICGLGLFWFASRSFG